MSGRTGRLSDSCRRLLSMRSRRGEGVLISDRESGCLRLRGTVLLLLLLLLWQLAQWGLLRCAHGRRRSRQGAILLLG